MAAEDSAAGLAEVAGSAAEEKDTEEPTSWSFTNNLAFETCKSFLLLSEPGSLSSNSAVVESPSPNHCGRVCERREVFNKLPTYPIR